jgi:hypothetical protein
MPEKTKLTVRVDRASLERAKRYAADHDTSLSKLISDFLGWVDAERGPTRTPILTKLTGILPAEASIEEHRTHLAKKYGV